MSRVSAPRQRVAAQRWSSPLVPGVEFEVIELTPEIAAEFLTKLPEGQRSMSERSVDRYAADLMADQFPFTGDSIKFNAKDELIDGQHRCQAVIVSEEPTPMLVIYGLNDDTIRFLDGGRSRKFPDDLKIHGYANHTALAAITQRVWQWQHGNYGYMGVPYVQNALYANTTATRAQLWKQLNEEPTLAETTTHAMRIHRYLGNAPVSVIGLVWWLLGQVDADAREKFFYELVEGSEQTGPEYPINVLRKVLTRRMNPGEEREGHIWLAYIIKGYNAWAEGRSISYLRMPVPIRWNSLPMPYGMVRPGAAPAELDELGAGDEDE